MLQDSTEVPRCPGDGALSSEDGSKFNETSKPLTANGNGVGGGDHKLDIESIDLKPLSNGRPPDTVPDGDSNPAPAATATVLPHRTDRKHDDDQASQAGIYL